MLNPVGKWRHAAVGVVALATPALMMFGVLGGGSREERFDAKQVLVTPVSAEGVRIREVVEDDFGTHDGHGYERKIPNDFGVPTDVVASSPDAPADLSVIDYGSFTRIRVGDPNTTVDGQHRYVLSYTLPDARLSTGQLALDVIGTLETMPTTRFEVVLAGFELENPTCNVGSLGTAGGCELVRDGDVYRVVIEPLASRQGVTVGGRIVALTEPADVPIPPIPPRRDDNHLPLALTALGLAAVASVGSFQLAKRLGRNEVGGMSAADAVYATKDGATRRVADADLDDMVTTEFVPPEGLRPWQGAILLRERVDSTSVSAWFSDQIALGHLAIEGSSPQTLTAGPDLKKAPDATRQRIEALIAGDGEMVLGTYHPSLAKLWEHLTEEQQKDAADSGWWAKYPPGTAAHFPAAMVMALVGVAAAVAVGVWRGWGATWPVALGVAVVAPAAVALAAYRPLLPVRSAVGTALSLRVESFRRFLQSSEGRHVEWAWSQGLLREYSAWAVALGAAEAWGRAVESSTVPPADLTSQTMPLLLFTNSMAWSQAHTAPPPSNSGGSGGSSWGGGFSGGFSGGSVGGGGGGGSSGNW